MSEETRKLILETEYRTSGDITPSVQKVEQLQQAAAKAQKDTLAFVEAEKKVEVAARSAGVAVETQTKKVNEFDKAVKSTGKAMDSLAKTGAMKDAFQVKNLDQFNVKLKEFQKNVVALAISGDKLKQIPVEIEKMVQAIEGLNDEDAAFALEEMGKEANRLNKLLENPTRRLRELKRLINTTDDPELLKQMQLEAGRLNDELSDTNELVRALGSDTFIADTLVESAQVATGAFSAFQGGLALVADENEELAKAAQKAQGALALLQGTQAVLNSFKKEDNVITRIQIVTQRAYAAVVGQSTGAMKGFRVALAATGVGLLIIGIAALVANMDKLKSSLGLGVNPELEKLAQNTRDSADAAVQALERFEELDKKLESIGVSEETRIRREQALQENALNKLQENQRKEEAILEDLIQKRNEALEQSRSGAIGAIRFALFDEEAIQATTENIEKTKDQIEQIGTAVLQGDNRLRAIQQEALDKQKDNNKKIQDERLKALAEEERTTIARANLARQSAQDILQIQIDFARRRLAIQRTIPDFDRTTIQQTKNNIEELTRELNNLVDGSIAELSDKVSKLRSRITESLVFGTVEFDQAVTELKQVEAQLKEANEALSGSAPEKLVQGSLKALQKQVTDLTEALSVLDPTSELFTTLAGNLKKAQDEIDKLQNRISGESTEAVKDALLAQLNESERHKLEMARIKGATEQELLQIQLEFAKKRLDALKASGQEATGQEVRNAENVVEELTAALEKNDDFGKFVAKYADGIQSLVNTTVSALQTFVGIAQRANDQLVSLQEKRVDQALEIADRGNVALLELEQDRLNELNKKREQFVRRQQQLAQIQLVSESLIAIAKAAAQGGAAAPFTIAATLIALTAGLAQARALANAQSFKKGGIYDSKGGFTGYGPPDGQSMQVGPKPYNYHYQEHIMPAPVTMLGHNKEWLEEIRRKRIDIGKMMSEKKSVVNLNASSGTKEIVEALQSLPSHHTEVYFDPDGFIKVIDETQHMRRKIKKKFGR